MWTAWHPDPAWPQCSPEEREGEGRGIGGREGGEGEAKRWEEGRGKGRERGEEVMCWD